MNECGRSVESALTALRTVDKGRLAIAYIPDCFGVIFSSLLSAFHGGRIGHSTSTTCIAV